MTLASAITRVPLGPGRGAGALLSNAAAASPYLARLIETDGAWADAVLEREPDAVATELIAAADGAAAEVDVALRRLKGRVALLCALADLGGAWTLPQVTGVLTRFADAATRAALRHAVTAQVGRGRLPADASIVMLAMGKMGAGELNYSSDIDLIALYEGDTSLRQGAVRATRETVKLLSEQTAEGYVFRTDLRLRPDPSVTPVCVAMEMAERYYESLGRTWERAAHIKARAAAGDVAAGEAYLERLSPFVWRRHLDFAAIEDAREMGRRIRESKGLHGPITVPGHDLKLGRGGIRAIEFAAQTAQLIFGGRDESLRARGTVDALRALAAAGRMAETDVDALCDAYDVLRTAEHRVQMIRDAQTHLLPSDGAERGRVAALSGETLDAFDARIGATLARVHEITGDLMGEERPAARRAPAAWAETLGRWRGYPALRSERARRSFERIEGELAARVDGAARPEEALRALDRFLARIPAGAQLFSLFEANPQLMDLFVDIAGTAPGLAAHLAEDTGVLDAVIGGSFFAPWPGVEALTGELAAAMAREEDYEARLDALRARMAERHFSVGVHLLRGLSDAGEAGGSYAALAEAVLRAILPEVERETARRYGRVPGLRICVLGMGSLGAGWLHSGSDLDLIVIYDGAGTSDGRRALDARSWAGKFTQALITALSAPMARGRLYEVDMRLRPSGRKGPVATSWTAFQDYQRTQAWVWEHLALTRARPVAGDAALGDEVEAFRRALIGEVGAPARVAEGLADMRARLAAAKPRTGPWDMRAGPGGMHDLELVGQAEALLAGSAERRTLAQLGEGPARRAHALQRGVRAATSLVAPEGFAPETAGLGATSVVLRVSGAEDVQALLARVDAARAEAVAEAEARIAAWAACPEPGA